jgi:glutamine synthetase
LDALEQDEVIQDALDQAITDVFVRAKQAEWGAYRIQVTDWELERLSWPKSPSVPSG